MTRKLVRSFFLTSLLTGLAVQTASSAGAEGSDIGFCRAEQLALAKVAGSVKEMERGQKQGRAVFDVEVRTPEGKSVEVRLDAADGTVLRVKEDD